MNSVDADIADCRYAIFSGGVGGAKLALGLYLEQSSEEHRVRFFFPLELERFLEDAGLRLASLSAFPTLDGELGPVSWNAVFVAQKA